MQYNSEIFKEQYPIVKQFVNYLIYYRELKIECDRQLLHNEFFDLTIDAHILQATIYWCMVFGSNGCQPTHWKNLSSEDIDNLIKSFREGLLKYIKVSQSEWNNYWSDMDNFRGGYVAHRELKYNGIVPNFDIALKVAFYYDQWVRDIISPDFLDDTSLSKYTEQLKKRIVPFITKIVEVAKKFNQ